VVDGLKQRAAGGTPPLQPLTLALGCPLVGGTPVKGRDFTAHRPEVAQRYAALASLCGFSLKITNVSKACTLIGGQQRAVEG